MRYNQWIYGSLIFSCLLLITYSCSEFCEGECYNDTTIRFNIFDRMDSTNLVLGVNSKYQLSDLSAFSINASDTVFYPIELFDAVISEKPSLALDHNDFTVSEIFLKFGTTEMDTMQLSFVDISASCCYDGFFRLNTLSYNQEVMYDRLVDGYLIEIYK